MHHTIAPATGLASDVIRIEAFGARLMNLRNALDEEHDNSGLKICSKIGLIRTRGIQMLRTLSVKYE